MRTNYASHRKDSLRENGRHYTFRRAYRRKRQKEMSKERIRDIIGTVCLFILIGFILFVFVRAIMGVMYSRNQAQSQVCQFAYPESRIYAKRPTFIHLLNNDVWEANKKELIKFQPDKYRLLSEQEKIDLAALFGNIAIYELTGEKAHIDFCIYVPGRGEPEGYYSHSEQIIAISQKTLSNPGETVSTIFHEVKHYQQCQIIELLWQKDALYTPIISNSEIGQWERELMNYRHARDEDGIITEENFEKYYSQSVEVDAREYAERRTEEFFTFINEKD